MWRFLSFNIISVGGCCVGCRFGLRGLLGGAHATGAVVSGFLHVVFFRQRWNERRSSGDLADALEDYFGAAVVELDGSVDFDRAAGEAAHVADISQVGREDHDREGAGELILAEVEEVDTFRSYLHADYFSNYAFRFADVMGGFVDG